MKHRFELKMHGLIEAQSFDDALAQLADHLTKLSNGVLPPDLFVPPGHGEFSLTEWKPGEQQWAEAWDKFDEETNDAERQPDVQHPADGGAAAPVED